MKNRYSNKTVAELLYIIKDASEAAVCMKDISAEAEAKYLDQVNDASSELYSRRGGGKRLLGAPAEIKVGGRVRSYDFADRTDCYAEGILRRVVPASEMRFTGCDHYEILVDTQTWCGVTEPSNAVIFPPVNGVPTTGGRVTSGVVGG